MGMYLARLAEHILEVLGKKRTPEDERRARKELEKKLKSKDAGKKTDKSAAPKLTQDEKTAAHVAKLKAMKKPTLFLINSNLTSMGEEKEEGRAHYKQFIEDGTDILKDCINLTNYGGIHSWIVDFDEKDELKHNAAYNYLEHFPAQKQIATLGDITSENPFEEIKIELEGLTKVDVLKEALGVAWRPIRAALVKDKKAAPKDKGVKKESPNKEEPSNKEEPIKKEAPKKQESKLTPKDIIAKIEKMAQPQLLVMNSHLKDTSTVEDEKNEEVKKVGLQQYKKFLINPNVSEQMKTFVNLANINGVQCWIIDAQTADLDVLLQGLGIPFAFAALPKDILNQENPFKAVTTKAKKGLRVPFNDGKIKQGLLAAWEPIAAIKAEERKEAEPKEQKPEAPPEQDKDKDKAKPEKKAEEKLPDDSASSDDFKGSPPSAAINVGKFRSLKDPHIFILDPRKSSSGVGGPAEYRNFLGPDKPGTKEHASKVLPKAFKVLTSRKMTSTPEGYPVLIYFLNGNDIKDLKLELVRERPHYLLGKFDKKLFDDDEPFTDLKVNNTAINPLLIAELNQAWADATSEVSGNPVPVVQANTNVPLDFFRFLNKKQRPIQFYIGNRPAGSGSEDTIYVLGTEQETDDFIKLVRKFKMPTLFYERMSANSDIDAGFKTADPEKLTPANALILVGKEAFNPREIVPVTEENKDLISAASPDLANLIEKISNLNLIKSKETDKAKIEKLDAEIADLKKELEKSGVNQLVLLHTLARTKLGNTTKSPGTFIRNKYMIGTHIVQFNANMTICFIWGSHAKHVKVGPKELIEKLPFDKTVITSYL